MAGLRYGSYLEIPGVIAASGAMPCEEPHSHHALQIIVAREGRFFFTLGGRRELCSFAVARSGEEHRFEGLDADCLTLFVEPHSELGRLLGGDMEGCRFFIEALRALRLSAQERGAARALGGAAGVADVDGADGQAHARLEAVLERFSLCDAGLGSRHTSIAKTYIDRNVSGELRVGRIAERAGLSLTRLQHVFKKDMGISMKRYMLWRRLLSGLENLHEGAELVDAALEAGFSDSAHFSRTCKAMLGLSPSSYVRGSLN
ncbi:MAG: AraC family transcriptional regulator [Spirochaetes bacterium]|nr:AraC family transcriptional regulator [Spirochaetota bacterium]MBU1078992.1 AraC family transcriptional regulator [Spirochaetota bacterium]